MCTLGNVCILNESPAEKSAIVFNDDSTGSQFVVQAFAGPLSPAEVGVSLFITAVYYAMIVG